MAVSLFFDGFTGPSATRISGVSQVNLIGADDFYLPSALSAPVAAGGRSYRRFISGRLLGSWTSLLGSYVYNDQNTPSPAQVLNNAVIIGGATLGYRGETNGVLTSATALVGASVGVTVGLNPTITLGFGNSEGNASLLAASNNLGSTVFTKFFLTQLVATPSAVSQQGVFANWKFVIDEN